MAVITIIGAGMMGSALSVPASDNGHEVRIVGTHLDNEIIEHARKTGRHLTMNRPLPPSNRYYRYEQIREALEGADLIVGGVSSFGVDWFADSVVPILPEGVPVLSVTKGLVHHGNGELETFPHYLARKTGRGISFNAVGGPCTSYELADRRHSAVAYCGNDPQELLRIRSLMETDYYHISTSTDVIGVECAVAMKNAYALAVSTAIGAIERYEGAGCVLAYNPQAAIFGQSVREMARMLDLLHGGPENIVYAAGDLYVTVFGGRTRRLGTLLGMGLSIDEALGKLSGVTLESVVIARRTVSALKELDQRGIAKLSDYPVLCYIGRLLDGEKDIEMPWRSFETEA